MLIAGALVFYRGNFTDIFWFSIIPYALNSVNFLGYPAALDAEKRTALLVAGIYFILHFLSSLGSRHSHRISNWRGSDEGASRFMWWVNGLMYALLIPSLWFGWYAATIILFVGIAVLENVYHPTLISRFNTHSPPEMSATVLSIESQSQSVATIVLAPLLGWPVDMVGGFWTVGVVGTVIAIAIVLTEPRMQARAAEPASSGID